MNCEICEEEMGTGGYEHRIVVDDSYELTHMCPDCWDENRAED
jgi:hypothetical protein